MAELSPSAFGFQQAAGPQELDPSAFGFTSGQTIAEGAFARAKRILQDPEGGVMPAAGALIDSALPKGGPQQGWLGDTAVGLARAPVSASQTLAGLALPFTRKSCCHPKSNLGARARRTAIAVPNSRAT